MNVSIVGRPSSPLQWKSNLERVLFFAGLTAGLAAASGCTSKPTHSMTPPRPLQGQAVRVACPDSVSDDLVSTHVRAWANRTGARVEVARYDRDKQPPPADVWIVPPADLPRWADAGQLLPVPDEYTARGGIYDWAGVLPLYSNRILVWDRKPYGLPLLGDAPVCFYRADRLKERGLAPPVTWDEFAKLAEDISLADGAPSLPPLPSDADGLDREFYAIAVPFVRQGVSEDDRRPPPDVQTYSFHYDLKTLEPRIATKGFVHALELLQRLQACRPTGSSAAPPEAFLEGKAVLCLAEARWAARFQCDPRAKDRFGICRVPGSRMYFSYADGNEIRAGAGNHVPYLGATGYVGVVPKISDQPDAAFALLADLSGRETGKQIVIDPRWGGGGYRRAHFDSPTLWYSFLLDSARSVALTEALRQTAVHPGLKNPVLRLRTPDQRPYQLALTEEVRAALTQRTSAAQALEAAAQRWRKLDAGKDGAARRRAYLLSLSLEP